MRHVRLLALLLLPLVFTSGCAVFVDLFTDPMGRKTAFRRDQREYTKYVRWGDIDGASRYVHPETREEFRSFEGKFEGIRITDFEVGEISYGPKEKTAKVRVTYTAYSMITMVERKIKEVQEWEREGKGNRWLVRPQLDGLVEQVADLR
jgi:hypothetical protein